jgi:TfoX/Sxy family transcriptional regulator of competence genes
MGSARSTVDFIVDQLAGAGTIVARKMFGEYGLYCDGSMFAVVCGDQLLVNPTTAGRAWIGAPEEAAPFPQARPYFLIPGDRWEEREWLAELARRTAGELPPPREKKKPARAAAAKLRRA